MQLNNHLSTKTEWYESTIHCPMMERKSFLLSDMNINKLANNGLHNNDLNIILTFK